MRSYRLRFTKASVRAQILLILGSELLTSRKVNCWDRIFDILKEISQQKRAAAVLAISKLNKEMIYGYGDKFSVNKFTFNQPFSIAVLFGRHVEE